MLWIRWNLILVGRRLSCNELTEFAHFKFDRAKLFSEALKLLVDRLLGWVWWNQLSWGRRKFRGWEILIKLFLIQGSFH